MALVQFAAHLGFPTPHQPLFDALVAGTDPLNHIAFAAERGFGGVLDPFAAMRTPDLQARIGERAARHGLRMGSFLYVRFDRLSQARWASRDPEVRATTLADVHDAMTIAARLGSDRVAIIGLAEAGMPRDEQTAVMAETLRLAGDLAGMAGVTLCVEGVSPQRLPQMLLHGVAAAAAVVCHAAHPAVRLCLDTGHALAAGEDPVALLVEHRAIVGAVQLADGAGRVELGGGLLDVRRLLAAAAQATGDARPAELEHRWSVSGPAIQRAYLEQLDAL